MHTDLINIALGFLEGLGLILSPCILPILPIILAGSLSGSKRRPIGIIIGFIIIFSLFTFFSRKLVEYSGIDTNLIRHISYALLFLLGIVMISTYLTEKFNLAAQRLANAGSSLSTVNNPQGGLFSGILFGGLVAIIWTPCAGPILAAIIVQTVIQHTTLMSFLTLIAFGLGVAIPMFIITFLGRNILDRLSYIKTNTALFRKLLGLIIIISVAYMAFFTGKADTLPISTSTKKITSLENGLTHPYPTPAIEGINAWINSPPLQLNQLKGKVILIDFWTYSCINCIRTLPYLKDWYAKYHDKGLVIIGVHSPEFDFEKNLNNVKNAVANDGIRYPVALDNQFITWQNFNNHYWPAHYLIDKNGYVVYSHFGEGEYDITENNIRYLLNITEPTTTLINKTSTSGYLTPETYLGYTRADRFSNLTLMTKDRIGHYTFPTTLLINGWALDGDWKIMSEGILAMGHNAAIRLNFFARKVFMVAGSATNKPINVSLLLNGKKINTEAGKDVSNSLLQINKHRLYEIISLSHASNNMLEISSATPGLEVYTFTFGE